MLSNDFGELFEESSEYLEVAQECKEKDAYPQGGWYESQAIGNAGGGILGAGMGADIGLEAAEPIYQAVKTTAPEAGPVVRLAGYSIPAVQAAISGILAYEGGRIGIDAGKHAGRYGYGRVMAGGYAFADGLEQIGELLDGNGE
jgi:hypothetical protein